MRKSLRVLRKALKWSLLATGWVASICVAQDLLEGDYPLPPDEQFANKVLVPFGPPVLLLAVVSDPAYCARFLKQYVVRWRQLGK